MLDDDVLSSEHPELYRLGQCIKHLHERTKEQTYSIDDLRIAYQTLYPTSNKAAIEPILKDAAASEASDSVLSEFLQRFRLRQKAFALAKLALAIAEGRERPEALSSVAFNEFTDTSKPAESEFIDDTDFDLLYAKQLAPGLRWRLKSLNKSLGSLRQGDFGFIFARPETGKTTFLASELTWMAMQATGPILWFTNEEAPEKVLARLIQAATGEDLNVLLRNKDKSLLKYHELTKSRIKLPKFEYCNRNDIERLVHNTRPSLVVFDQIDKIRGFQADRNDLELTEIYLWARELAKRFCPVIGICQAGATAEGKRWLTFNDVNNSKTGKQGEADWMLGIGKSLDESLSYERFLFLSKNKLFGDPDSDASLRHNKWSVRILPEIARYEDF